MKKINIREALLDIDRRTNAQYDLTTLYEACKLSEDDKKKVVQYIDTKEPPFMIGEFLASKCDAVCEAIVGDDEVSEAEMKKIVDIINDGSDHTLWALMNKADKEDNKLTEAAEEPRRGYDSRAAIRQVWRMIADSEKLTDDDSRYWDLDRGVHEGDQAVIISNVQEAPDTAMYQFSLMDDGIDLDVMLDRMSDNDTWYIIDNSGTKYGDNDDSLNEDIISVDTADLENKIRAAATDVVVNKLGYDEGFADKYVVIEVGNTDEEDARVRVEVRADLSYEEAQEVADALNPIVKEYDKDAYFDAVTHNTIEAYIRLDQSDDVVDEEAFNYWKGLFDKVTTRGDLINYYKELVRKRDEGSITWGTMDKLFDEVIGPLNDRLDAENTPKIEESMLKPTSKKLRKEYLLDVFDADEITELAMAYISPRNSKHALSYILKNWDDFYFEDEYSEWLEDNHPEIDTDLDEAAVGTMERPMTELQGTLSSILSSDWNAWAKIRHVEDAVAFLNEIAPQCKNKGYIEKVKSKLLANPRTNIQQFFTNIIMAGDGQGVVKTGKSARIARDRKDLGEGFGGSSLYLFPELTAEDLEMAKAYGLTYLGKNHGPDGSENNCVVAGDMSSLQRYADKYLGYELHPDYLYDDADDFAGEIIQEAVKYPNGQECRDDSVDMDRALDYMFGTDRDPDINSYTEDEKQRAVDYWIKKTDSPFNEAVELTICPSCGGERFNDNTGLCVDCGYDEKGHGDLNESKNAIDNEYTLKSEYFYDNVNNLEGCNFDEEIEVFQTLGWVDENGDMVIPAGVTLRFVESDNSYDTYEIDTDKGTFRIAILSPERGGDNIADLCESKSIKEGIGDELEHQDILDWLDEHNTAYEDAQYAFGDVPLKDVPKDELISWIEEHKQLYDDFINYFYIDFSDLDESKSLKEGHQVQDYKGYELDWNEDGIDSEEGVANFDVYIKKDGKYLTSKNGSTLTFQGFKKAREYIDSITPNKQDNSNAKRHYYEYVINAYDNIDVDRDDLPNFQAWVKEIDKAGKDIASKAGVLDRIDDITSGDASDIEFRFYAAEDEDAKSVAKALARVANQSKDSGYDKLFLIDDEDFDIIERIANYGRYINESKSLKEAVEYVKWVQLPDGKWKMWGSNNGPELDPDFLDRARKQNNIEYKDAKVVKNGESPNDASNKKELKEYYEFIDRKSVEDSDGFMTDYSMYRDVVSGKYVFVFGDSDIYSPEDEDFDWECETEEEARQWFNSYNGFADEDEEYSFDLDEGIFKDIKNVAKAAGSAIKNSNYYKNNIQPTIDTIKGSESYADLKSIGSAVKGAVKDSSIGKKVQNAWNVDKYTTELRNAKSRSELIKLRKEYNAAIKDGKLNDEKSIQRIRDLYKQKTQELSSNNKVRESAESSNMIVMMGSDGVHYYYNSAENTFTSDIEDGTRYAEREIMEDDFREVVKNNPEAYMRKIPNMPHWNK